MGAGESNGHWHRIDQTLLSIQYLRAGSTLTVVLVHAMPWLWDPLKFIMSLSIDLFFLISGFIVVMIADDSCRPWSFFRRRLERIVPLYWFGTIAAYWLVYSGALNGEFHPLRQLEHLDAGPLELLIASLLFVPMDNPAVGMPHPILSPGWTLNYEMMFYLCFACALPLARRWLVPVLTLAFLGLLLTGGLFAQSMQARFWTSPLIFEFVAGLWIGLAWRRGWDFRLLFLGLMVAWVPLTTVTLNYFTDWPLWPSRVVGLPIVLALCLSFIALDRRAGGLPEWRIARLLGDASYSIYLFHYFAVILAMQIVGNDAQDRLAYFAIAFGGGIGLGLTVYWFLERPTMRWFKARRRSGQSEASPERGEDGQRI